MKFSYLPSCRADCSRMEAARWVSVMLVTQAIRNRSCEFMTPFSIGRSVTSILLVRNYDACMPHSCYILYSSPSISFGSDVFISLTQVATESELGLADAYINGWCSFPDKKEGLLNLFLVKLHHQLFRLAYFFSICFLRIYPWFFSPRATAFYCQQRYTQEQ
jgi:hypothetical protein